MLNAFSCLKVCINLRSSGRWLCQSWILLNGLTSYLRQRPGLAESFLLPTMKVNVRRWGYDCVWARFDESRENGNAGRMETACEVLALFGQSATASSVLVRQTSRPEEH